MQLNGTVMLSAICHPVRTTGKVLSAACQMMKCVFILTAIAMAALSLGIISPGTLLVVAFLYLFFAGMIMKCGTFQILESFGKACACTIIGILLNAGGIPFLFSFGICIFLIWAVHQ